MYSHANGKKRVTFRLLPSHDDAMDGKTRGWKEIGQTIEDHVHKASILVFDKWTGTIAACKRHGYTYGPPVNHSLGFREQSHGFHSNDVESENNKIKQWLRQRYGALKLGRKRALDNDTVLDLYEYVFKINVGESMTEFMKALAAFEEEANLMEQLGAQSRPACGDDDDASSDE